MKSTVKFSLTHLRPESGNKTFSRMHWSKRAAMARSWRDITQHGMLAAGIRKQPMTDCVILVTAEMIEPTCDCDNLGVTAKLIIDGMKKYVTSRDKLVKVRLDKNRVLVRRVEQMAYLLLDDALPHVKTVILTVLPALYDRISVEVTGDRVDV